MENNHLSSLPRSSVWLEKLVAPLDRFFDRLYHSRYNPLYRSGTLAVGLFVVLVVTGLYLLLSYSVSTPNESIQHLTENVFLGQLIRGIHRYATDAAILAVFLHILQLLIQGKTYGPRTLAWVSGVALLGLVYLAAWTGYVMVWDVHGQLLALAGAKMLGVLPLFQNTLEAAFNGSSPLGASFFFINLFLHVALPVGLIFGLWIHTSRIARTKWFPIPEICTVTFLGLVVVACWFPAPVLPGADPFRIPGKLALDLFVAPWLLLAIQNPSSVLAILSLLSVLLFTIPLWWRVAKAAQRPISAVDAPRCSGCTQCVRDCPYHAISMVPRPDGKKLLAEITPNLCVSCGICTASCDDLAIGPPGRDGESTRRLGAQLLEKLSSTTTPPTTSPTLVTFVCLHNGSALAAWREYAGRSNGEVLVEAVDCCGTVHTQTMESVLGKTAGVMLHACPERNCFNRDGLDLATQRIWFKRVPFLARSIDRSRLLIDPSSDAELKEVFQRCDAFRRFLQGATSNPQITIPRPKRARLVTSRALSTVLIFAGIAAGSQIKMGSEPEHALLRISAKLRSVLNDKCRALTAEEKQRLPLHMQKPEICESVTLAYRTRVRIDDQIIHDERLEDVSSRTDRWLPLNIDIPLSPGQRRFEVVIDTVPSGTNADPQPQNHLAISQTVDAQAGQIFLVTNEPALSEFEIRGVQLRFPSP